MSDIPTTNIPTELLRTLTTVVDLRSFTRAAQSLGVTQPAVSAQIKRLQQLLGADLFDKSAPGVTLTQTGELVLNHARRMLAVNDQILSLVMPGASVLPLRVGIPGDFAGSILPKTIAEFQACTPHLRFQLRGDSSENLLRDLRQGQLDLVVALSMSEPVDARHAWREQLVWIRGQGAEIQAGVPLPLVTLREGSLVHQIATSTLSHAGRDYKIVFIAFASVGLIAAVSAGLGVALMPRLEVPPAVEVWEDAPLPKPIDIHCGIYVRDGTGCEMLEQLAGRIADSLRARAGSSAPSRKEIAAHPATPAGAGASNGLRASGTS
jgi:DNA-binding transcriptional LysR family regulator